MQLGRTFRPKVTNYRPNGGARDTYIHANCGGFKPYHDRLNVGKRIPTVVDHRPKPELKWPTNRYYSDGSGRDFYVTMNSGGSQCAYVPGQINRSFVATLRSDTAPVSKETRMRRLSPGQAMQLRESAHRQRNLMDRLHSTSPRHKQSELISPYKRSLKTMSYDANENSSGLRTHQRTHSMDRNFK